MSVTYSILTKERVVYATFEGVISTRDIEDYRERLRDDPDFSPSMSSLADFSRVTTFGPTAAEIRRIVEEDPFGPDSKHAAVASTDVVFGMLRMYEFKADRSGENSRVFRGADEARAWLGLKTGNS